MRKSGLYGKKAVLYDKKKERKNLLPPRLYNLNDLQKDSFSYFGYSAEKTLSLVQKLYEEYKCVSYPRTPSTVMGSANVELCQNLYKKMLSCYVEYLELDNVYKIKKEDTRIFNDAKLEAHHAIIPLDKLPPCATGEEENVYNLILERFMLSFAPACLYDRLSVILEVNSCRFLIEAKQTVSEGWKKYRRFTKAVKKENEETEELQNVNVIDWNNLHLKSVTDEQKLTKAPKYYNEGSILSFMENPRNEGSDKKLCGLGTPATRHTFIPKLKKSGYIEVSSKNILMTELGKNLLFELSRTPLSKLSDICETTRWEEELCNNPIVFEQTVKSFLKESLSSNGVEHE